MYKQKQLANNLNKVSQTMFIYIYIMHAGHIFLGLFLYVYYDNLIKLQNKIDFKNE